MTTYSHRIESVIEPPQGETSCLVRVRINDSGATFKKTPQELYNRDWLDKFSPEDVAYIAFLNAAMFSDGLVPIEYFPRKKHQLTMAVIVLAMLFVTFLLMSNMTGFRLVDLHTDWLPFGMGGSGSVQFTAGLLVFPATYIFSTLITEVYGYKVSRLVIWGGMFANLLLVAGMWMVTLLPASSAGGHEGELFAKSYTVLLDGFTRTFFASSIAYLSGEFVNSTVLAKLKIASAGKYLWLRILFSTGPAIIVDTVIFCALLFHNIMPVGPLVSMMLVQITIKSIYELCLLPVSTRVSQYLKKIDDIDYYDFNTIFNPFSWK